MTKIEHRFTFDFWNKNSSVRSKSNTYALGVPPETNDYALDWYPRPMLPYLRHVSFQNIPEDKIRRLLARHLVYFLDYTMILEHLMVNLSLETIIYDSLIVKIPKKLKSIGLQIYTDEGYHAQFSNQLASEIASAYKINRLIPPPFRISKLNDYIANTKTDLRHILYFSIGFISETIIAKEIRSITADSLAPQAYTLLTDHLEDETVHAYFFAETFNFVWTHSSSLQKDAIASMIPPLLKIFCSTDIDWLSDALGEAGLSQGAITDITESANAESLINQRICSIAPLTFSALRKVGFFEISKYAQHFRSEGLPYA